MSTWVRKKWAIPFHPNPIDQAWVRAQLAERGIVCEVTECTAPAELALENGNDEVPLVCSRHYDLCADNPALRLRLERQLWDEFDRMFNFIRRNEDTHGQLLVDMERAWFEREAAEKQKAVALRKLAREVKRDLNHSKVRIGSPDDELVAGGAQPPSPDAQPVIRWPEPIQVAPVRLTLFPDEQPLLLGGLLPIEPANGAGNDHRT